MPLMIAVSAQALPGTDTGPCRTPMSFTAAAKYLDHFGMIKDECDKCQDDLTGKLCLDRPVTAFMFTDTQTYLRLQVIDFR